MNATRKQAWLLDLDGTLYRPLLVRMGMSVEVGLAGAAHLRVIRAFRHAHELLRQELRDHPERQFEPSPYDEQVHRAAAAAGSKDAHVREVVQTWMIDRPLKWLARSKRASLIREIGEFVSAGGVAGVVSDYPAEAKLRALGIDGLFRAVVANGEHPALKRLKPAPDGYLLAAEELGVAPADCLVIGDRRDADGLAAQRAGMAFRLIR